VTPQGAATARTPSPAYVDRFRGWETLLRASAGQSSPAARLPAAKLFTRVAERLALPADEHDRLRRVEPVIRRLRNQIAHGARSDLPNREMADLWAFALRQLEAGVTDDIVSVALGER
jgi:hypothetical protein